MIEYATFLGDVNIGYYAVANNNVCILGEEVEAKNVKKIKEILKVKKVYRLTIAQTNLIGLFAVINDSGIVVPHICEEDEISKLEKICKKEDLNLEIINNKHTALGNLILCNNNGCIASKLLKQRDVKKIESSLNVKVKKGTIASLPIVGSCGVANNNGAVLHRDASEKEVKNVEETLGVDADIASVNFGSPYVKSGILCNDKGVLVGEKTTGPELARISEILSV